MSTDDMIGIAWLTGALAAYYPAAHIIAHSNPFPDRPPEAVDWVIAVIIGAVAAFMWPVLLVIGGAFMVSKRLWTGSWQVPWKPIRTSRVAKESE